MKKFFLFCMAISTLLVAEEYSCGPCTFESSWGAGIYADFLFWKAEGDQLDYGIVTQGTTEVIVGSPDIRNVTERWLEYNPKWKSGVRVGIQKDFGCNDMGAFAEWTWYQTKDQENTSLVRPDGSSIFLFTSGFINNVGSGVTAFQFGQIDASFRFLLNRIDVGFYKKFCCCNSFLFRPYATFTYAYLRENMEIKAAFNDPQSTFFKTDDYRTRTKFNGYGVQLGAIGDWEFFPSFSLVTEASLTGLLGRFDLERTVFETIGGTVNALNTTTAFPFDDDQARWISKLRIALCYRICFCNCYQFLAQVGWEQQVLFDQTNWMIRDGELTSSGDKSSANLYLQGLTAGLAFYF